MGLNTCRKQWKEQRKQNKIENLKIHSTSLARMFFTLQMQVTMANKPGWVLGEYEAVYTITWGQTQLQGPRHSGTYSTFQESLPSGFPKWQRSSLSITVLSAIPFTHLHSGIFQATSHLAPWFSNDNSAFWEHWAGRNSNLVFGPIPPHTIKRSKLLKVLIPVWKERFYMAFVFLLTADPKLELTRQVLQVAL